MGISPAEWLWMISMRRKMNRTILKSLTDLQFIPQMRRAETKR